MVDVDADLQRGFFLAVQRLPSRRPSDLMYDLQKRATSTSPDRYERFRLSSSKLHKSS